MQETIKIPSAPDLTVRLKRSARARRLTLRIGRTDGAVTLTVPRGLPWGETERFLTEHVAWIRAKLADVPKAKKVCVGQTVPIRGADVPIVAGPGRVARFTDGQIVVRDDDQTGARVKALLISIARREATAAVDRHAAALGTVPTMLRLRDTRSRWGSCTSEGRLMLSWRLAMAPPEVLDYVAAHEVAHLRHMDHSPRFWAQVEALKPDYALHRQWLRDHGATLQSFDFKSSGRANVVPDRP